MNSKLIGGVTEFLTTERELQEVSPPDARRHYTLLVFTSW